MAPSRAPGYCNRCDAEREVLRTVPWQEDVCVRCGSPDVSVDRDDQA